MHRIGVIPFDLKDDDIALLFVTSQTRGRWILPKGKMKSGESHAEACAREAFEEAGIRGFVMEDYPMTTVITRQIDKNTLEPIPVTYYPFYVDKQKNKWPEVDSRERHWALLQDAHKVIFRRDFKRLLKQFEELAPWITRAAADYKSDLPELQKLAR